MLSCGELHDGVVMERVNDDGNLKEDDGVVMGYDEFHGADEMAMVNDGDEVLDGDEILDGNDGDEVLDGNDGDEILDGNADGGFLIPENKGMKVGYDNLHCDVGVICGVNFDDSMN